MKTALLAASALVGLAGAASAGLAQSLPVTPIDPARLSAHIRVLGSDAFEGRGPATAGETKSIDYISKQFAAAGVQPGGPNHSWFQDVPLARFEVKGPVKLALTAGGQTQAFTQGEQAVVQTLLPVDHVAIHNAPLVFVGYGVKASECGWDDFKGVDLHGKIAVVLINDPDFEAPQVTKGPGCFGGKAMTYYGRWTYKYEEAARQGALGMLIVHETAPAAYGWATVKNSNGNAQFDIVRADPTKAHALLQGWIQRDATVDLFRKSGLDFEAAKRAAQSKGFRPVVLKGATFSADYDVDHSRIISHNVVGRLPGKARPNETVIYSAHWDHLGVGAPDAKGDRIYNGAVDNGTGIAALIELARVYAHAPRTQRSILFLAVTAEEKGLLGSEYYATHPLYPLATTVADLNMDALHPDGPAHDISISGGGKVDLEDRLAAAAKGEGRYFSPDEEPEKGHFYRSDHFSFAKVGVPAISIESGVDLYNGGKARGVPLQADYVAHRYHQPGDEWSPNWDLRGAALDVGLVYKLGRTLADSDTWPQWKPAAEFKAARDSTAAERK
ncbi:MAG: M28 family metallopeptidase [Caulobacteraceae bacterium]